MSQVQTDRAVAGRQLTMQKKGPRPGLIDRAFAAEKLLLGRMLEALGNPALQLVLWDGQEVTTQAKDPLARVLIHDRGALLKLIAQPELQFGEMYALGRIDVEGDLARFLEAVFRALPRYGQGGLGQKLLAPFQDSQRNTLLRAQHNVHHHYDIGNDFYRLWLDRQMVYTCAYFPNPNTGLEEAQIAKFDHVCRKLRLKAGETVVEAGCGWGALALHMAKRYGVTVKAYNISKEQLAVARERAQREGLDDRVEFIEDDYRNLRGEYDAFVSVGMLEHVGTEHFMELGSAIHRSLKASGRGLLHSIGLDFPRPLDAWTQRHIFPGACPPSLSQMMDVLEPFEFSVLDVENLRLHYAKTLEHWLQRYEAATDSVAAMFDAGFVRTWRLYLSGSLAAFRAGNMQLFQVLFSRSRNNQIPWTRDASWDTPWTPATH